MRFLVAVVLLVLLSPATAYAEADCAVVMRLQRAHGALVRMHAASTLASRAQDLEVLRAQMTHLNVSRVEHAFSRNENSEQNRAALSLVALGQIVLALANRNNTKLLQEHLNSAKSAQRLHDAQVALAAMYCSKDAASQSGIDTGQNVRPNGPAANWSTTYFEDTTPAQIAKSAFVVILANVIGVFGAIKAMLWLRARSAYRRRQSKRFPANLASGIWFDGKIYDVRILDISCHGAKLKNIDVCEPEMGTLVDVYIDGGWHAGQLVWANPLYFGINFQQPLRVRAIRALAKSDHALSDNVWAKEKAARVTEPPQLETAIPDPQATQDAPADTGKDA